MKVDLNIISPPTNEIAQMHTIGDDLDISLNDLNQVPKDQGGQVDLVACLEVVHEPIVGVSHCGMFRPYG